MKKQISKFYARVWRWHFYAGIVVAPFLIILAITGLGMVLLANTTGRDLDQTRVAPQEIRTAVSIQAQNALNTVPNAQVLQYIAPRRADTVAIFRVKSIDDSAPSDNMVLVNPYSGEVVDSFARDSNWYHKFDQFHGDLMLGVTGDYLQETAASLTILLIVTGIYLWWQKNQSLKSMLVPAAQNQRQQRLSFRTIHATLGSWVAIVLLFFCISGLAWSGIWGGKMVQAWSQFPAGKWDVEPTPVSSSPFGNKKAAAPSAKPHVHGADNSGTHPMPSHGEVLNDGKTKEVPWILEQTPMPMSGTMSGKSGLDSQSVITIDRVDEFARQLGFSGRYQLNLPQGDTGVWTLSQDSMSYDLASPFADRTVHLDRYSGNILADIRFSDYNAFGKFMAAGLALHMGTLGFFSILANVLFCLSVIAICLTGLVMWWQRRPDNSQGLQPPASQKQLAMPWSFAVLLIILAAIFPTAIIAIGVIAILDVLLIRHLPMLQRWLK